MKQMNTDEVSNMTMINTTWVKKAGGGTCNVPSTEEAHEVKRLLCDLYDHERNRDKRITALEDEDRQGYWSAIEERLTALEECLDVLLEADCSADKRITALEAHDKCQNCAVSPYIEAEKKTCATCAHALSLDKYDDILCLRASVWQHPRFESPDTTDCDHYYERED